MATRALAFEIAQNALAEAASRLLERGFKCSSRRGDLGAKKIDGNVFSDARFILLDYEPTWRFQVTFAINWKNVYCYTYIGRPNSQPAEWRKVAMIGVGTPRMHGRIHDELTFTTPSSTSTVSNALVGLLENVGVPFFDKWSQIEQVCGEFYEITPAAREVSVLPSQLSMIAVACALIYRTEEFAKSLVPVHRAWLATIDEFSVRSFDQFVSVTFRSG